jgi:hypothetical protein
MSAAMTSLKRHVGARDLANLTMGIEKAVAESIMKRPQRDGGVTGDEMKRRAQWCVDTALMLIRERRWSSERVADTMPDAIIEYLDTGTFTPSEHRSWITQEA